MVASRFLRRSGSEESIQWESRPVPRHSVSVPTLCPSGQPKKAIGLESHIGPWLALCLPALLASFRSRMASTTNRVMKQREWEQLGLGLRREKAVQTKWQPARGAGCARSSTASGGGRKMSLDIPFYRTSHRSFSSSGAKALPGPRLSSGKPR